MQRFPTPRTCSRSTKTAEETKPEAEKAGGKAGAEDTDATAKADKRAADKKKADKKRKKKPKTKYYILTERTRVVGEITKSQGQDIDKDLSQIFAP